MSQAQTVPRRPLSTPTGAFGIFGALLEFWRRRDLLWHMVIRHLRGQYKQSILGYAWAFVNPLSQMIILSFVMSTIIRVPTGDTPYPLFLFVGLVPWIFFSGALSAGTDGVTNASSLVTKVYFPREVLPTAAVLTKLVDLTFGMLILGMLMVYYSDPPTVTALWFIPVFGIQLVFTLGLALPLSALNLYYHDVRFLVGVVLTLWFYLTPILYPADIVPEQYQWIFEINPMSLFTITYRRVILEGEVPDLDRVLVGLAIALATFLIGYWIFKKMERGFADSI
jgi:ABC-type polysaccharide/polyol phosphate export permease